MSPVKTLLHAMARAARPFKPLLEWLAGAEARVAASWAARAHRHLYWIQWGIPPTPEHFEHRIDLYYLWNVGGNARWLERGVFNALALKGGDVLEIACGDGFNSRHFYSPRARRVVACDFDPKAIRAARGLNSAPNVEYVLADVRTDLPEGVFDNVIMDAAIEHFSEDEIHPLLEKVRQRLSRGGVFSGHTMIQLADGRKSLEYHEREFAGKEDLLQVLRPHFANVTVFETTAPRQNNLYWWASDGPVPFGDGWGGAVRRCAAGAAAVEDGACTGSQTGPGACRSEKKP
jgi:SAM-dependent methyltransferase